MSTLLMGAFFLAATSMFVSCKDYDDDINANTKAIQNVESTLKAQIAELNSALQQEKTSATAAHSQYVDAIAKAQAAADAAQKSLADAIAAANSSHATKTELSEGLAPKANRDEVTAAIAELKTSLNDAINAGDNATAQAAQAALTAAIDKVNASLEGVKGDLATVTNAQTEIKNTLTTAIATLDKKANQTMVDAAVNALNTALAEVKQSAATKEAVQNAIDLAKGEIAKNVQAVEAAAAKAQADATSAQQDLAKLAEKVNTYAAAQAAAEAKIEQLQKAIAAANELEGKLQEAIAGNSKDIATLRADLTQGVANLDAQIKSVNENLSKLIAANTNTIQDLAGTVGNIRLQINALENFCGNLEALNVPGIRDSMRLSFAQLKLAEQTARENLAAAEVRAAETAAGYVAALAEVMKDSAQAMKKRAQEQAVEAQRQTEEAIAEAKQAVIDYVDAFKIDELWDNVEDLNAEVYGEGGINDQLEFINKTLTWSASGKPINLEEVLINLATATFTNALAIDSLEEVGLGYDLWKAEIDQFVQDVKDNKANYITVTAAQTYADNAVETAVNALKAEDAETYVAKDALKAMVNAFLADADIIENLNGAGLALTGDIKSWVKEEALADYLKTNDLAAAIEALETYLPKDEVQRIATKARTDARADAAEDTKKAIAEYDAALAASFEELFNQLEEAEEEAEGDDDAAEEAEAPTKAQAAIGKLAELLKGSINLSEEAAEEVNVLRIQLALKLTSLVFYPELYYGGIESIEITAMKIDETYKMKDASKNGTVEETFEIKLPGVQGEFNVYPSGYAKYHINPVNAGLDGYTLSFIDHSAKTRSAENPYLIPVEPDATKNYRDENDILWVEFQNDATIYSRINKATNIPTFAHNSASATIVYPNPNYVDPNDVQEPGRQDDATSSEETEYLEGDIKYATSHNAIGKGTSYGQAIVAALVAENAEEDEDAAYVASDYALLVPITINRLVLASSTFSGINDTERALKDGPNEGYQCVENTDFHLYTQVLDRVEIKGKDNQIAVDKLMYNEEFDLTELVETHFKNSPSAGATDEKVSDDLFRRLNLAYRFYPITYTRGDNLTSESQFITLTGKDENGDFNGIGYFNQVKEGVDKNGKPIGTKIEDASCEFGPYKLANDACLGRQPIVRVELYRKDMPELVYAVGYLRLEIAKDVARSTETIDFTARQQLFANCDNCDNGKYDEISLSWDQIQEKLNDLKDGQGLSPEAWNGYSIVKNEDGDFAQYVDDDNDPDTDPVIIDRLYGYKMNLDGTFDTSSEFYPWYYVGEFELVNSSETEGIHTKVLKWKFDCEDYQAIYFDLQMHDFAPSWINTETGIVKRPITRYVKLHHSDSANPDLFVGVTIPAGTDEKNGGLRFAAGTVGAVKGAYWKDAASNKEGTIDMVINVDLKSKTSNTAGNENGESDDVKAGKIYKNIIKNLFGEKIQIDLNLAGIDDDKVKALAASKFANAQNFYDGNAIFYFRAPDKDNAKEAKVIRDGAGDGQWVVYGISGNKYTLEVTDKEYFLGDDGKTKFYMNYGSSVSIVKINGKKLDTPLVVMTVDTDRYTDEAETTLNADFSKVELLQDDAVKGYTQDMLNYAKHDWESIDKESTTERPYEMQLTAFMCLVADNGFLVANTMPVYEYFVASGNGSSDPYDGMNSCYILPENVDCFACETRVVSPVNPIVGDLDYCYKPFVDNTKFAVRFYQPVYISNGNKKKTIEDANLANQTPQTVNYKDVLYFEDWAGYVPGGDFRNFIHYYGIQVDIDPDAKASTYTTATADAKAKVESLEAAIFGNALPANGTNYTKDGKTMTFSLAPAEGKTASDYLAEMANYYDRVTVEDWDGTDWSEAPGATATSWKYIDVVKHNHYFDAVTTVDENNQITAFTETFTGFGNANGETDVPAWILYFDPTVDGGRTAPEEGKTAADYNITEAARNAFNFNIEDEIIYKRNQFLENLAAKKPTLTQNGVSETVTNYTAPSFTSTGTTTKEFKAPFKSTLNDAKTEAVANKYDKTTKVPGEAFTQTGSATKEQYKYTTCWVSPLYDYTNYPETSRHDVTSETDAADAINVHGNYLKYTKDLELFNSYFGAPKLNPEYVAKPTEGNDERTLKQKQMYLYPEMQYGGAFDVDGDLSKYITPAGEARTRTDVHNAAKYLLYEDGAGIQAFIAALDQYAADVLAAQQWAAAIVKTKELADYVEKVRAHAQFFHMTGDALVPATKPATLPTKDSEATAYTKIPNAKFPKYKDETAKTNLEVLTQWGARYVKRYVWESLMQTNPSASNGYNAKYDAATDAQLTELANAIVNWYEKSQVTDADEAALIALLKMCKTDLGFSGEANRKAVFKASEIEQLPSIYKVAPTDLDLDVYDFTACTDDTNGGIKGSFKFQYTNNNGNTNTPFHVYIPLWVTYHYANVAPAAPIKVWAVIEVTASKDNTQTK